MRPCCRNHDRSRACWMRTESQPLRTSMRTLIIRCVSLALLLLAPTVVGEEPPPAAAGAGAGAGDAPGAAAAGAAGAGGAAPPAAAASGAAGGAAAGAPGADAAGAGSAGAGAAVGARAAAGAAGAGAGAGGPDAHAGASGGPPSPPPHPPAATGAPVPATLLPATATHAPAIQQTTTTDERERDDWTKEDGRKSRLQRKDVQEALLQCVHSHPSPKAHPPLCARVCGRLPVCVRECSWSPRCRSRPCLHILAARVCKIVTLLRLPAHCGSHLHRRRPLHTVGTAASGTAAAASART